MWVIYAFGSSFFAGITAILAKIGIKNVVSKNIRDNFANESVE